MMRNVLRGVQRNRCAICSQSFGSAKPTFEHVHPRSKGGANFGNIVLTHAHCNAARGDAMPNGCLLIMLDAVNARLAL